MIKCNNCGTKFDDKIKYCTNCGNKIKKPKTKISKKLIIIGSSCIALIVAAIVLFIFISQPKVPVAQQKKKLPIEDFVIYYKNNDLYLADLTNDDNVRITHNEAYSPSLEAYMVQEWGVYWNNNTFGVPVQYSKEANRLFFADLKLADPERDDIEIELYYTLRYLDLNDIDAGAVTIDNTVRKYYITNNGDGVVYAKHNGEDISFYEVNLKDNKVITKEINNYEPESAVAKSMLYYNSSTTDNPDVNTKKIDGKECLYLGKKFIDDNIERVLMADDDKIIYCTDLDKKTYTYTLKIYENRKSKTITNSFVCDYIPIKVNQKGDILYTDNHKFGNDSTCDLYVYKNGTSKKIASGVQSIY